MPGVPPVRGEAFIFYCALTSQANPNVFQTNPTLAVGDVRLSTDGGALNNITALPTVTPAGAEQVEVNASAAEMTGDVVTVLFSDVAGNEWQDLLIEIFTETIQIRDLCTLGAGAFTWTYTLTSTVAPFPPIPDADVWVTTDVGGTNVIAAGRTDAFGVVTFYLDAGTIYVWRQKSGWNFTNPDVEVVP